MGDETKYPLKSTKTPQTFAGAFPGLLLITALAWLGIGTLQRLTGPTCEEFWSITEVGGCDLIGNCSVLLRNGEKSWGNKPVVGEKFCSKNIGYFDWYVRWKRVKSPRINGEGPAQVSTTAAYGIQAEEEAGNLVQTLAARWHADPTSLHELFARLRRLHMRKFLRDKSGSDSSESESATMESQDLVATFCQEHSISLEDFNAAFNQYRKLEFRKYLKPVSKH